MTDIGHKLHAANDDLRSRIASEHDRNTAALMARLHRVTHYPACTNEASPCRAGSLPCPSPEACQRPADDAMDDVAASVWFWGILAVALVTAAYLWSGGAADIAGWIRGAL